MGFLELFQLVPFFPSMLQALPWLLAIILIAFWFVLDTVYFSVLSTAAFGFPLLGSFSLWLAVLVSFSSLGLSDPNAEIII